MKVINRKEALNKVLASKTEELEKRDFEILKNREKKYIPIKIQKRTLTTEFGQLKWKRRIYKYYDTKMEKWCYIALLDEEIGLKKWAKIDEGLIEQITKQIWTGKRYKDIVDMFKESELSIMTISRIFRRINYKDFIKDIPRIKINPGQKIYINTDDTWPKVWKGRKKVELKVRVISFNLGFDKKILQLKDGN